MHEAGDCILIAISGGADSLALAHALSIEALPLAIRVVGVTIDHQLQSASGEQANKVIAQLLTMGITENEISKVSVEISQGLEASARKARYEALDKCAEKYGAVAIYLGHTRDDQAESVLLGLGRGSGTRSLSAMAQINGKYFRPLLAITREQTEKACAEMNLIPWNDPHNSDKQFARVRVRNLVLPNLEENIGPGISEALARSAQLLRDDADALDAWTEKEIATMDLADLECEALAALPKAIRTRILRRAIYDAGAPSGSITAEHVSAVEALVTSWSGQGPAHLPGGVKVSRLSGRLSLLQH
jgi:tRNA(Ile)-lysidine synthase